MGGTAVAADDDQRSRRLRPRNIVLLVIGVLVVVAIALLNVIHVPVVILRPGPVQNIFGSEGDTPVLRIEGLKTYPVSGTLDFTTVSMSGGPNYPVSVMEWIGAQFDSNAEIDPRSEWFPDDVTGKEVAEQNTAEMTNAQETAKVVALRAAGHKVPEQIKVAQVADDGPAKGHLKVGDIITKIEGTSVNRMDEVSDVMSKVEPGDKVDVQVTRDGKTEQLHVPTVKGQGHAVFGIAITPKYTMPAKIKLSVGDVGGPSAGTMMALAIYDKLTPGKLTGGKRFAGTGTISEDGVVGPIGGLRQKMAGAKNDGAKFFLAPKDDCSQARGHEPDGLTVIKVSSFAQAVSVVKKVANGQTTGLPHC